VLALLGAGWGLLCRELLRLPLDGALVVPFGIAAVIVVAGLLTASASIAPATVTVIAVVAALGLVRHAKMVRPDRWVVAVGVLVLLAFGAPVILSGQATFAGYIRLDDTATWLSIVDRVMSHGRSLAGLPSSTYELNLHAYLDTMGYPIGAFLPLGIGRALVRVDAAWVFQPYLAFCGAMVGLVVFSLSRFVLERRWLRALVAFLAAQPALLYGYSQWGGIKELTAAFLLALLAAVLGMALSPRRARRQTLIPLAIVSAALAVTLGPGAVAWLAPALLAVGGSWLWRARAAGKLRIAAIDGAALAALAAVLMLPVWLELSSFISGSNELFSSLSGTTSAGESGLVSLFHPLSVFQLAGPWPVGDFRLTAPAAATIPLIVGVVIGLILAALRPSRTVMAYPAIALLGCVIVWLGGANPWVLAKALAIASPAIPAVALVGVATIWQRNHVAGLALIAVIGGGILWSNVLAYHDVMLAPKARLSELQEIAPLLNGHGPTLINEYEVYADRHFLRDGAPTEPAEYRPYPIPLADGRLLTQSAYADLDAFSLTTLLPYPSIVTRTSPVASRPPSVYRLRWQGRYYQLWQRPQHPSRSILVHVPLGDSGTLPFCGQSTTGYAPLCPIQPVASASCRLIARLARLARSDRANLVAYQRPAPIIARADQTQWPGLWLHDLAAHTLTPTVPGTLEAHIRLDSAQRYELWLGGSFQRGFEVSVDGRALGRVKDQLSNIGQYILVGALPLSAGEHTIALQYPDADLTPGSGAEETTLSAIVLEPLQVPATRMMTVDPRDAATLCGRELDWVEVVARSVG
jgi:hypothetical protein